MELTKDEKTTKPLRLIFFFHLCAPMPALIYGTRSVSLWLSNRNSMCCRVRWSFEQRRLCSASVVGFQLRTVAIGINFCNIFIQLRKKICNFEFPTADIWENRDLLIKQHLLQGYLFVKYIMEKVLFFFSKWTNYPSII